MKESELTKEEVTQKGDEIIEILEVDLVKHIQQVLKLSTKVDLSYHDAEVILAKIGKKMILKIMAEEKF